jgi:hypothetical protein
METLSSEREARERGEGGFGEGNASNDERKIENASYLEGLGFNTRRL